MSREAFETWFSQQPINRGKRPNRSAHGDGYYTASTDGMWHAWQAAESNLAASHQRLKEALDHIIRRLQMDIDDGSRPDQWSMEDLVRVARAALKDAP